MRMRRISIVVAGGLGLGVWATFMLNKEAVIKTFYSPSTGTDEVTQIIRKIYPWMVALPIWQLMTATSRGVYIGLNKCVKESAIVNIIGSTIYFLVGLSVNEGALGFAISMNAAMCVCTLVQYFGANSIIQKEFIPDPVGHESLLSRYCFWRSANTNLLAPVSLTPVTDSAVESSPVGYASRIRFFAERVKSTASAVTDIVTNSFKNCRRR